MPASPLAASPAARPAAALLALLALLPGCGGGEGTDARPAAGAAGDSAVEATDEGGTRVRLDAPARRVLSLVPSGTDIVVAIGGAGQLAGRTRYDDAPEVAALPSVGGGLDPGMEALAALRPDLVLAWELTPGGGTRAQVERLGVATFALQTPDTGALFRAIGSIGVLTGRDSGAAALVGRLRAELDSVRRLADAGGRRRVFYVVSTSPAMTAGPDTFVGQLVSVAGGDNVFPEAGAGWPTVSLEEVVRRDPEVIVLPVGEDPTNSLAELRARPGWREIPAVRDGRVVTVPADIVNRPGPRMGEAARMIYEAMGGGGGRR